MAAGPGDFFNSCTHRVVTQEAAKINLGTPKIELPRGKYLGKHLADPIARKRGVRARVREILMQDWDPIGISGDAPRNEYDTYAAKAHAMLMDGATVEEIAAYLLHIATENMGLTHHAQQAQRAGRAAEALVSLRRTFEMHDRDGK